MKPISTREAAALLGCSQRHVRTLIVRGKIAAELCGGKLLLPARRWYTVDRRSVMRYLHDGNPDGRGWPRGKKRK